MLTSHQSQHISVSLPQPKSSKPPKYQSEDRKRISFPHLLNNIIMGFTSRSDNQQLSSAESIDDVLHNSAQDDLGLQDRQNQPPLNCPRCNSVNTKFCYYNNHNKSQPRHFCKACKRHWTAGGTLRDVPVGGNRRTKRLKTSGTSSSISTSAGLQQQQEQQYLFSIGNPNNSFVDSALPSPSLPTFTFTNLASFEDSILPFSFTDYTPFQPSESDEITRSIQGTPEDPSNTSSVNTSNTSEGVNPSWVMPSTGSFMESLNDWSFNDLNMLISTSEINQSWGDFQNEQRQL